jgi:hypothetical protein
MSKMKTKVTIIFDDVELASLKKNLQEKNLVTAFNLVMKAYFRGDIQFQEI